MVGEESRIYIMTNNKTLHNATEYWVFASRSSYRSSCVNALLLYVALAKRFCQSSCQPTVHHHHQWRVAGGDRCVAPVAWPRRLAVALLLHSGSFSKKLLLVLLWLSSLRFLSRYLEQSYRIIIAIIPVRVWRYICAVLLHCKHNRFTTSLLKFQHASLHAAPYCERRSACQCATLGEQSLHEICHNCI